MPRGVAGSAPECEEQFCRLPAHARGLCSTHYRAEMRRAKAARLMCRTPGCKKRKMPDLDHCVTHRPFIVTSDAA